MSETPHDAGRDDDAAEQSTESHPEEKAPDETGQTEAAQDETGQDESGQDEQPLDIPESLNFRVPRVSLLAVLAVAACAVPLATTSGPLGPLVFLIPLALLWLVLRPRTTVDAERIKVRGLVSGRTLPWESLQGLAIVKQSQVRASTTKGGEVTLPNVRPRDLPAIALVSRGHLPDPTAESSDEG
ncbi:PH domain-containing protein [Saccharopolyspora sp. TS4A08]|uniref:PH domain-containing protein n=1 Tax=Saccharopolyspora ipomoeae TaxID=3042027 RepID=A0ABT6PKT1_9PSEU|nr:PH domain-containing protein [Saccharopolyspora sp. TS4A08]MDI2028608.1 PH domain-containing protein [Saccharopolyspora sp. TS4A08]